MSLGGFFKAMLAMGPKWLVITDGQNGAYLGGKDGILHCPVLTGVTISSTAGAGDAFASTLSAFLAEGSEPDKALLAATTNAGSVVSVLDTQSGLLKRDALMARLKEIGKGLVVSRWEVGG